jgi:hypothetical protein
MTNKENKYEEIDWKYKKKFTNTMMMFVANNKQGHKDVEIEKEVLEFWHKQLDKIKTKQLNEDTKFMAWCECGDALECITVPNKKGFMVNHEYYCFGCDKTYILTEKK